MVSPGIILVGMGSVGIVPDGENRLTGNPVAVTGAGPDGGLISPAIFPMTGSTGRLGTLWFLWRRNGWLLILRCIGGVIVAGQPAFFRDHVDG